MKTDAANAASPHLDRPQGESGERPGVSAGGSIPNKRESAKRKRESAEVKEQRERMLDLARQAFAEKRYADTLHTCDLILALDPDNFFALRYIARIRTQRGDIDGAEIVWRRLCASPRNEVEPAINVARFAERREQWDTLAEFADLALSRDPERLDALRMAIQARVRTERFADLFDRLPRLYAREPERALGFLRELRNPEQLPVLAEAFLATAQIDLEKKAPTVLDGRGHEVWLVGARRAMAEREDRLTGSYLRTVLVFEPSSREAVDGLAILSRDSLINLRRAIKKGDRAAAVYHAEITIEIYPTLVEAWFSLARLIEPEDPDRAAEAFRTCARLCPENAYYRVRIGRALKKAHKPDQALTAYEQASVADTDPLAAEISAAITDLRPLVSEQARALTDQGRIGEAWTILRTATGRSPLRTAAALAAAIVRSRIAVLLPHFKP